MTPIQAFSVPLPQGTLTLTIDKIYEDKIARQIGVGREFAGHLDMTLGCLVIEAAALNACVSSLVRFRDALERMQNGSVTCATYQSYYDNRLTFRLTVREDGTVGLDGRFVLLREEGNVLCFAKTLTRDDVDTLCGQLNRTLDALREI